MKQVIYVEHYPHYLGTRNATVRFTVKLFEEMIDLAKKVIKEYAGDDDAAEELLEDRIESIAEEQDVTVYALREALTNFGASPRRPATIMSGLKKKGVWSGEWEEGSFAFATTERKAKVAVAKIEAKHQDLDW